MTKDEYHVTTEARPTFWRLRTLYLYKIVQSSETVISCCNIHYLFFTVHNRTNVFVILACYSQARLL